MDYSNFWFHQHKITLLVIILTWEAIHLESYLKNNQNLDFQFIFRLKTWSHLTWEYQGFGKCYSAKPNPNVLSFKQTYITQQNAASGLKPILY